VEEELIHQSAAAYALDGLTPEEERAFEAHLAGCPRCQKDVASFSEAAAGLAYAAPAAEPPSELKERILAATRDDHAEVITLRPRWAYPALAVAAVAACAAIALGIWAASLSSGSQGGQLQTLALHGATGSVIVTRGGEAALVVSGLPRAPHGKTYEVWVMHGRSARPAGLFTGANRTATVHLSRPVRGGSVVAVTLERAGGSPTPTGKPLFTSTPA
jgi:anti-sigma-K factor RskA